MAVVSGVVVESKAASVYGVVRRAMDVIHRHLPQHPRHGNERLHFAQVVGLLLSAAIDPAIRSLRSIEQFSSRPSVRDITGRDVVPRSTLSDSLKRFDPEQLRPLIAVFQEKIPWLRRVDPDTGDLMKQLLAADGSWFNLAGEVTHALKMNRGNGKQKQSRVRLNLQFDLDSLLPVDCDVSGHGDGSEAGAFIRRLKKDCVYIVDRNFVHFGFINAVHAAGSNLVLRLRKDTRFDVREDRVLSPQDHAHDVILDQVVTLCGPQSKGNKGRSRTDKPPGEAVAYRRIVIRDTKNDTDLILLTDLLDMPAYLVGAIYRRRWQIELFLRWLKVFAGFEHLISQSPRGITTQFYVAVLLTLLLHLQTGAPVGKHTLQIVQAYAQGLLDEKGMILNLTRRERERALQRLRRERKRLA